jgi:putative membrane protein
MRSKFTASMALIGVVGAMGVSMASCSDEDGTEERPPKATATANAANAHRDTSEFAGEVATDSSVTRPTVRWLTDANVLSLLNVMNAKQIAAADVELESWHLDNVRAFASTMAREHAELQHSIDSLAERIHLAPITPALAQSISAKMQAQIDSLRWSSSRSLDRAFVKQQVASHELMANYVADLIGVAEKPELRAFLTSTGDRVGSQRARAQALLTSLVTADSIAAADSAAKARAKLAARRTRAGGVSR